MFARLGKSVAIPLTVVVLVVLGMSVKAHCKAHSDAESITGIVLPSSSITSLTAQCGNNRYSVETNNDGSFAFESLPEGTYSVYIESGDETLNDTTIAGVAVKSGETIDLGTIRLSSRER